MLRALASNAGSNNGKPLEVTTYTSGSGTYTPPQPNSWVRVTVVAGGSSGVKPNNSSSAAGAGGAAGGTAMAWLRLSGPVAYSVGSGGYGYSGSGPAASTLGGASFFHTVVAPPTQAGVSYPTTAFHVIAGGDGCQPGSGTGNGMKGRMAGVPSFTNFSSDAYAGISSGGIGSSQGPGGGGGGDSLYGIGGVGGNAATGAGLPGGAGANATGYGAGGGGGGASSTGAGGASGSGSGGIIIVEYFGV